MLSLVLILLFTNALFTGLTTNNGQLLRASALVIPTTKSPTDVSFTTIPTTVSFTTTEETTTEFNEEFVFGTTEQTLLAVDSWSTTVTCDSASALYFASLCQIALIDTLTIHLPHFMRHVFTLSCCSRRGLNLCLAEGFTASSCTGHEESLQKGVELVRKSTSSVLAPVGEEMCPEDQGLSVNRGCSELLYPFAHTISAIKLRKVSPNNITLTKAESKLEQPGRESVLSKIRGDESVEELIRILEIQHSFNGHERHFGDVEEVVAVGEVNIEEVTEFGSTTDSSNTAESVVEEDSRSADLRLERSMRLLMRVSRMLEDGTWLHKNDNRSNAEDGNAEAIWLEGHEEPAANDFLLVNDTENNSTQQDNLFQNGSISVSTDKTENGLDGTNVEAQPKAIIFEDELVPITDQSDLTSTDFQNLLEATETTEDCGDTEPTELELDFYSSTLSNPTSEDSGDNRFFLLSDDSREGRSLTINDIPDSSSVGTTPILELNQTSADNSTDVTTYFEDLINVTATSSLRIGEDFEQEGRSFNFKGGFELEINSTNITDIIEVETETSTTDFINDTTTSTNSYLSWPTPTPTSIPNDPSRQGRQNMPPNIEGNFMDALNTFGLAGSPSLTTNNTMMNNMPAATLASPLSPLSPSSTTPNSSMKSSPSSIPIFTFEPNDEESDLMKAINYLNHSSALNFKPNLTLCLLLFICLSFIV